MTITQERPIRFDSLDAAFGEMFGLNDAPVSDRLTLGDLTEALFGFSPPAPPPVDEPELLDVNDVREAFALLNPMRLNPKFGADGGCRYGDPQTLRPSCIAGAIIAILAPDYYREICEDQCSVSILGGIHRVFTARAIDLLQNAQAYADGKGLDESQLDWGDAMQAALFDQLELRG
jgi:hypothetical protein